jgi:hypothetical protein
MQESISYGELAELGSMFDEQIKQYGLKLYEDDYICLFHEFCCLYQAGNMNPNILDLI